MFKTKHNSGETIAISSC